MQFNYFGLKKLIATGYTQSDGSLTNQLELFKQDKKSYYMEINSVSQKLSDTFTDNANNSLSNYDLLKMLKKENFIKELKGDGDFRSDECIELLKQADIIVTNPPFSLFREYVDQLMKYNKQFLIIGNKNAITYKEVFRYIKDDNMWLGYNYPSEFLTASGEITKKMNGLTRWFTNLPVSKRNEDLILYRTYYKTEEDKHNPNYTNPDYPKYDNYDAIEVSKVVDIPIDYEGVMGVPITFLDKYTPKQFEIVKFRKGDDDKDLVYTEKDNKSNEDSTDNTTKGCKKAVERERATYKQIQPYFRILVRYRGNR